MGVSQIEKAVCQREALQYLKNDIPEELKNIRYKIIEDGYLQVFENGRVFYVNKRGRKVEATYNYLNGYKMTVVLIGKKQKTFYIHRLLAKAFIPNPKNKKKVVFLDNDRKNLDLNNIAWMTQQELVQHNYDNQFVNPYKRKTSVKCKKCGRITNSKTGVCIPCNKIDMTEKKRAKRTKSVEVLVKNMECLTQRQTEIVLLRFEGLSTVEIAKRYGISKQAVHSLLQRAENRVNKHINNS